MKHFKFSGHTPDRNHCKGGISVNIKTIMQGISIGASVGTAYFMLASAKDRKKRSIKRHAGKMLKAAGSVLDDITSVVK